MKQNKVEEFYEPTVQNPSKWASWDTFLDCKDCVKSKLRAELSWLRRKSALKPGQESGVITRACGRCQTELGLLINRGALCPSCKQRVCKDCRKYGPYNKDWVCVICSKQIEIQLATGEWMNAFARRPSRRKEKILSPVEGVRNAILRRSWSISSPTTSTWDICEDTKRTPPAKPPRKSLPSNENAASRDSETPKKPSRRYSMSSFDAMSSGRRSLRGDAELCFNRKLHEDTLNKSSAQKTMPSMEATRYFQMDSPPKYFFGSTSAMQEVPRPSTLPRRPDRPKRPLSYGEFENDINRFNSIPRRIQPRSANRPRELSPSSVYRESRSLSGSREPYPTAGRQQAWSSNGYKDFNSLKRTKETYPLNMPQKEGNESHSLSGSKDARSFNGQRDKNYLYENQESYFKSKSQEQSSVKPQPSYYSNNPQEQSSVKPQPSYYPNKPQEQSSVKPQPSYYSNKPQEQSSVKPQPSYYPNKPQEQSSVKPQPSYYPNKPQEQRSNSGLLELRYSSEPKEPRSSSGPREPSSISGSRELNYPYEPRESRSASGPRDSRSTFEPNEPRSASGPREPRSTFGSNEPKSASGPREPRSTFGSNEPRSASGPREHRSTFGSNETRSASGPREPRSIFEPSEPRSASGPREPRSASGSREQISSSGSREQRSIHGSQDTLLSGRPITREPNSSKIHRDRNFPSDHHDSLYSHKSQEQHLPNVPRDLRSSRDLRDSHSINELQESRLQNTFRSSSSSGENKEWHEQSLPRKNLNSLSYISSGPVTSTPISSSVPNDVSLPLSRQELSLDKNSKYSSGHRKSVGTLNEIQKIDDGYGSSSQLKRLKEPISLESSCSDSSFLLSPDISDESRNSTFVKALTAKQLLPRSNTSITSGYASMGRLRRTGSAPVRRTKSFQSGQRNTEENLSPRRISGSHVAKFVQELEKGIQETFSNMSINKLGVATPVTKAPAKHSTPYKTPVTNLQERETEKFYSDTELDNSKISNGDKYKIVFISSGSSKDSESNSLSDSENYPNADGRKEGASSVPKSNFLKVKRVDASVMTDAKDTSSEAESEEDASSLAPQRASSPEGDSLYSATEFPKKINTNSAHFSQDDKFNIYNNCNNLPPIINQSKLQLMLKQTEEVEAEAQAFQKALMGAFEPAGTQDRLSQSNINYNQNNNKSFINDNNLLKYTPKFSTEQTTQTNKQTNNISNEYENVLINKNNCKPLYENVDFRSSIIKPIKMCKSVSTQTSDDLESSWEGEDHYESTSYYSDVSEDSLNDEQNPSIDSSCFKSKYSNTESFYNNNKFITKQNECSKRKGQESSSTSSFSPSFTYLPDPATPSHSPSPQIHLRLALKKDNSSVSLSSECESVRKAFDANRDCAESFTSPETEKSVLNRLSEAKVNFLNKSVNIKCAITDNSNSKLNFKNRSANNNEKITLSKRNTDLTSGGCSLSRPTSDQPILRNEAKIKSLKKKIIKMSSENTLECDSHEGNKASPSKLRGNVNAAQEVIPTVECSAKTPSFSIGEVVSEDISSGTSEGDDTDDDTHVSKSYDVSKIDDADLESDGEVSNHSGYQKESPSSNSETDEEEHVSDTYDVTKLPTDSESENERVSLEESREINCGKENNLHTRSDIEKILDNNIAESAIDGKKGNLCGALENSLSNPEADFVSSDNIGITNSDKENNSETINVNILDDAEKTELPECDQALDDCVRLCNAEKEMEEPTHSAIEEDDYPIEDRVGCSVDTTESTVENKSETESNFGVEVDVIEPLNDICERGNEFVVEKNDESENTTKEDKTKDEIDERFSVDSLCGNDGISDNVSTISGNDIATDNLLNDNEDKYNENINKCNEVLNVSNQNTEFILSNEHDVILNEKSPSDGSQNNITEETTNERDNETNTRIKANEEINSDFKEELVTEIVNTENESNVNDSLESMNENLNNANNELSQNTFSLEQRENLSEDNSLNSVNNLDFENSLIGDISIISTENKPSEITGSKEVEQGSASCSEEIVSNNTLSSEHEQICDSAVVSDGNNLKENFVKSIGNIDYNTKKVNSDINSDNKKSFASAKEISSSSESGHSSGGESDVDKEPKNVVKINVAENYDDFTETDNDKKDEKRSFAMVTDKKEFRKGSFQRLGHLSKFSKSSTPPVPLRKAKWSSSSDGLSSSSDVERSDVDASDSADTVIEGNKLQSKKGSVFKKRWEEANRDSDGPSSADSLLQGADSESQCSDGSEEGNLITIVAVGEETILKPSSQGKIYIRSDSTDSDVQIKPTCIVVTGSSGTESSDDSDKKEHSQKGPKGGNDVTILEVTSDHRKDHVMSVRVTSPESSRSASPSRKSTIGELQSMILTTREKQQQFRRSPVEIKESSSLTNYFTVTLGTDSPITHRRINKTPEVRRRKVPERDGADALSSPVASTPTPTFSPSHTPSPTLTPTPDHAEGDLLAYDDYQEPKLNEESLEKDELSNDISDEFHNDSENYDSYNEGEIMQEGDATFDSIEDGDSLGESNYSETSSEEGFEREEELRGFCKRGFDFTLHTIVEESCEDSDYDKKVQEENVGRDPSELEKYFYFGLGNGPAESKKFANEESEYSDTFSETSSSIYSEGMESLECEEEIDPAELASSRLEKYFSGFSGFERQPSIRSVGEESEIHSDESDSVGSDSEGSPSPEQPRKKLFRSRGVRSVSSSRSHGCSSDKGDGVISDGSHNSGDGDEEKTLVSGEDEGSTESEETAFDKGDGQFDTIKRRKKKKALSELSEKKSESEKSESKHFLNDGKDDDMHKSDLSHKRFGDSENISKKLGPDDSKDQTEEFHEGDLVERKYQSRDSGFIGSSDDLLKDKPDDSTLKDIDMKEASSDLRLEEPNTIKFSERMAKKNEKNLDSKDVSPDNDANNNRSENEERSSNEGKVSRSSTGSSVDLPPYSQSKGCPNLTRKDSFNNWSSDEETNIMMNKMRIFFKNMFSNVGKEFPKGQRGKSPQLVMFEAKLTNLMRSVPGINDEQVKEIVEYLSSEETWSDSYDSSDYTSSDLEGAYARLDQADPEHKSELQEQISASCQQIIKKFDISREPSDTDSSHSLFGGRANSESSEASSKDTAFVYQRLMSSISHMKPESDRGSIGSGSQSTSPSLFMKIMPFIRDKLVALMYEVEASSENGDDLDSFNGGLPVTSSPRQKLFLPKKHSIGDNISLDSSIDKSSLTSSEDSPTDTEQSPESETGTPKIFRRPKLSIISERSSTEDFTSIESQRTVFDSHDSPRYQYRQDSKMSHSTPSQRSLEDRTSNINQTHGKSKDEDKFTRENVGLPKSRNGRRSEARKAKSHMSLEKIHQEDVKQTGERSESLGDLLDRVRSSSEFSSSYEQLDSDSTLKASDSLDRHIGSSSSNVRLNASSRGSLTTSSRGSLATSSRGSLNASSRGSLQGSSGPDEEEERKAKKLSFFRYSRRSSVPDAAKEVPSPEMRSTTLPRSTPAQILTTGTLPRTQSSQATSSRPISGLLISQSSTSATTDRSPVYHTSAPRSARYHPPGYRPPPAGLPPKRTYSTPTLRKDRLYHYTDESGTSIDETTSTSNSTPGVMRSTCTAPPPPSSLSKLGCGSPLGSPLGGSLGRASGSESVGGSLASFENSSDEVEAKRRDSDGGRSPLISLGPKSRSESLASVYSYGEEGRYSKVPVQGEIRVALQYNYKEGQLECSIIQCRDLAPVDAKRIRSDPYVKAYLLPDKSKSGKKKTKVKRHTVNPNFEETFKFVTTLSELESRVLWISVWHSDMFGRNMFLGEVHIPLSDAIFEDSSPKWHPLLERKEPMETLNYGAVLIVALKFVPPDILSASGSGSRKSKRSRGALQVRVKEASGLTMGKSNLSPPDPICKGVLMPEKKGKSSKQKTSVLKKTSNPKWNYTMNFDDVTLQELTERSLELSIWNHDRFGSPTFLGGCRLNLGKGHHNNKIVDWLDASGLEQKLWEQMLDRPNLWVESSILLRPNIDSPIYSSAYTD